MMELLQQCLESLRGGFSPDELQNLERALGFGLPDSLRELYQITRSGYFKRRHAEIGDFEYEIHELIPAERLASIYRLRVGEHGALPRNQVPFARDSGGNYYCVDVDGSRVSYAVMDVPDEPLRPVSDSLEAFLGLLFEEPSWERE